jgi:hypothetical protein
MLDCERELPEPIHSHPVYESGRTASAWNIQISGELGTVTCRNGMVQYKIRCPDCGARSGALPYSVVRQLKRQGWPIAWKQENRA